MFDLRSRHPTPWRPRRLSPQTDTTNPAGFYRFVALPPGQYTLTFVMTGFSTQKREGVRSMLGATRAA